MRTTNFVALVQICFTLFVVVLARPQQQQQQPQQQHQSHHHTDVIDWILRDDGDDGDLFPASSMSPAANRNLMPIVDVTSVSAAAVSAAGDEEEGDSLDHHGGGGSTSPVCIDIPANMTLCSNIAYTRMRLPNLLGQETFSEIQIQSAQWLSLINTKCHRFTQHFLCSLFAPICVEQRTIIWPCRELCVEVKASCEGELTRYGFAWPEMFDCDKRSFPRAQQNALCLSAQKLDVTSNSSLSSSSMDDEDNNNAVTKPGSGNGLTPYVISKQIPPAPTPTLAPTTPAAAVVATTTVTPLLSTTTPPTSTLDESSKNNVVVRHRHHNNKYGAKKCTFCATTLDDRLARRMFCDAHVVLKVKFRRLRQGILYGKRARIFKDVVVAEPTSSRRQGEFDQFEQRFLAEKNRWRNPLLRVSSSSPSPETTSVQEPAACITQCIDTIQYGHQQYLVFARLTNDTRQQDEHGTVNGGGDEEQEEEDLFDLLDEDDDGGEYDDDFVDVDPSGMLASGFSLGPIALPLSSSAGHTLSERSIYPTQQQQSSTSSQYLQLVHFLPWRNDDRSFKRAVKRMKRARCKQQQQHHSSSSSSHRNSRRRGDREQQQRASRFVDGNSWFTSGASAAAAAERRPRRTFPPSSSIVTILHKSLK